MRNKLRFLFARDRFAVFFWTGVVLLVLGLGILSYANSVVEAHKQILQGDLSPNERDRVAGSLTWWRLAQVTVYDPVSLIFIVAGTFCIFYACAWASLQPTRTDSAHQ
jgi:heme exporter protein D